MGFGYNKLWFFMKGFFLYGLYGLFGLFGYNKLWFFMKVLRIKLRGWLVWVKFDLLGIYFWVLILVIYLESWVCVVLSFGKGFEENIFWRFFIIYVLIFKVIN